MPEPEQAPLSRKALKRLISKIKSNRTLRYGSPFSLIMLDIDHFKQINDQYGHATGDKVLCEVSQYIGASIRKADLFARLGGEEFIILCPETDLAEAIDLAQKLCGLIDRSLFEAKIKISCSFGVVKYTSGDRLTDLLQKVDEKLYQAKRQGRNRVEF
ncbi:MAG: hypothetical protein Kow0065_18490 [Methylomicrobium sp.]